MIEISRDIDALAAFSFSSFWFSQNWGMPRFFRRFEYTTYSWNTTDAVGA